MKPSAAGFKGAGFELWGLTGGVASGKSTAARFFEEAGIPTFDADQLSRELSLPGGAAYDAIIARFGTADRGKLRKRVFEDASARRDLEAILHPIIALESGRRAAEISQPGKPVIYEAALLIETGRAKEFSGLIVVDAPRALRRERLISRDHIPPELADGILSAQATDEERRAAATVLIQNTGMLDELKEQVTQLIHQRGWDRVTPLFTKR